MTIVILRTNTSDFGKVGSYNVQEIGLANAFFSLGHKVVVLYMNKAVVKMEQDSKYEFVYYLPHCSVGLHGIFRTKILKTFSPNLVIHFSDNQLWTKNVVRWCTNHGVKCIEYLGNVLSDNPNWLHQFYTKLILYRNLKWYKKSINVAKTGKVKIEMERLGVRCDKVISVGLDTKLLAKDYSVEEVKETVGIRQGEKIILFVGRIVDYKKPIFACEIINRLTRQDDKYRLFIIGKGVMEDELMKYIENNKLKERITYMKSVPYNEIYKYMVSSDVLINLSDREIFGMTILEAMYYGTPVVAHCAPGPNDMIVNGTSGYLLDNYDLEEWKKHIELAIQRKSELSEAARVRVEEKYFWDAICKKFLSL